MPDLAAPFMLLQNVLNGEDLAFLRAACKRTLLTENVPCFALLEHQDSAPFLKIKEALEAQLNETLYYLNDFYIYTDSSFRTNWHMDTELFTFENAVNAWILLSPDSVEDPLGIIPDVNDCDERYYHSVTIRDGECSFRNYRSGKTVVRPLAGVEAGQAHTPLIRTGDVLLFSPKYFHKTNVTSAKHAFSMKFVFGKRKGFLSPTQVPSMFWPEVKTFNDIVKAADRWEDVLTGIREALKSEDGKKKLSSGFYPEKFDLYKQMVQTL